MNTKKLDTIIQQFGAHMMKGAEHLYQACKIYAEAVANDHVSAYAFAKAYPHVTKNTWDKFRMVGINALDSGVLVLSDRLGGKLAMLPIREQRSIITHPVKVATATRVRSKDIRDLTEKEEKLVFTSSMGIRTVEQQRKQLEPKTPYDKKKAVPYTITGEVLRVRRACVISKTELTTIIKKMGK